MTTANQLVNYLLELNILNAEDVKRELGHISARIRNPVGQKWLNRAGWFALNNIDKLADMPRPPATGTYQHQHSPDYPTFNRTEADPAGVEIDPDDATDYLHTTERGETLGELAQQYYDDESMAAVIRKVNPDLKYSGTKKPERRSSTQAHAGKAFGGSPRGLGEPQQESEENVFNRPLVNGQQVRIPSKARLVKHGLYARGGAMPKLSNVYDLSQMAKSVWQKDIEQSFKPLKPHKQKKVSLPGDQPTAGELPPWAAGKEATMHHFDPVMASQRELWQDIQSIAHYFNFISTVNVEDHPDFKNEKETLFKRLEGAPTHDLNGFLEVLVKAREWMLEVKHNPWKFTKGDPAVVYKHRNGFAWKRLETLEDLQREGTAMHHCIGTNYTYRNRLTAGTNHDYYSLRDQADTSYLTIETQRNPSEVWQIKGRSDETYHIPPAHKLMARDFINSYLRGYEVTGDPQSLKLCDCPRFTLSAANRCAVCGQ